MDSFSIDIPLMNPDIAQFLRFDTKDANRQSFDKDFVGDISKGKNLWDQSKLPEAKVSPIGAAKLKHLQKACINCSYNQCHAYTSM
eukprot:2196448-Pyramimonas_sp.AAC.2